MEGLDTAWLTQYLGKEINRLKKIEDGQTKKIYAAEGEIGKYKHLISLETSRDAEYQRALRIAEKKLEEPTSQLEVLTPKIDKLVECWAILSKYADV